MVAHKDIGIIAVGLGREGPLCAGSSPISWIFERLLSGKPTFIFRLVTSGVDPYRDSHAFVRRQSQYGSYASNHDR